MTGGRGWQCWSLVVLYGMSVVMISACIFYGYFEGELLRTHRKNPQQIEEYKMNLRIAWGFM
jgi:hypothetical protein